MLSARPTVRLLVTLWLRCWQDGNTALHHALAQSNAEAALALMQSKHKAGVM